MTSTIYQRWKQGMKDITPAQQLHAKMVGHLWAAIGLIMALVVMFYRGIWYFAIVILATIWLQWWEYKGARQQYERVKEIQDNLDGDEVLKKL